MKKGFTLVEIIISISIILIVGVSTTFFALNKKSNNELENITKDILEAANLYANNEVDENGNIYIFEVRNGKKGIQIPLSNLVNKGYVDKKQVDRVKDLTDDENYYVMLLEGNNESYDYCGEGKIFSLASWTYNGNDVYLCDKENNNNNDSIYNKIISMDYYTQCAENTSTGLCLLKAHEELVDANSDGTLSDVYYFRGNALNNYLKFNGIDRIFRIVRTTEDNGVKIVENEVIDALFKTNNLALDKIYDPLVLADGSLQYKNYVYYEMDGFKIKGYMYDIGAAEKHYTCNEDNNTTSWSDNKDVTCVSSSGEIKVLKSPLYTKIYKPLLDNYNVELNKYILEDYKWCISSEKSEQEMSNVTFKCNLSKNFISKVGILNIFEYDAIQEINELIACAHCSVDYEQVIYGKSNGASVNSNNIEIAFGSTQITTTITLNPKNTIVDGNFYSRKLRPTYVIKGNSKIVSGDGTEDHPFIIDGFTN